MLGGAGGLRRVALGGVAAVVPAHGDAPGARSSCSSSGIGIAARQVVGDEFDAGAGFSSERLGRSGDTRLAIWDAGLSVVDDHPLGAGPGSAAALSLTTTDEDDINFGTELHSDPLGLLVENGLLGLVAVIAIGTVVWRATPPGGIARTLIVGLGVGSFVRETINFRHLWIGLAIAVALDWQRTRAPAAGPAGAVGPVGGGAGAGGAVIALVRQVLAILDARTRRGFLLAVPASIVMAAFESIGFAMVLPFMQLLADPTSTRPGRDRVDAPPASPAPPTAPRSSSTWGW